MAAVQAWYQTLLVLSMLVCAGTTGYVWLHRDRRGALPLTFVFASATLWGAAAFVQEILQTGPVTLLTSKVILFAVVLQTVSFLLFALAYTGRDAYVTRRVVAAIAAEPIVFTALVWTNQIHELVWTATLDSTVSSGVEVSAQPLFWAHTLYSYSLLAVGVFLIVVFAFRSKYLYQRQAAALVVATLAPWVANAASLTVIDSYHLTPIAFALTAVVLTWAVVNEDFLDITPVATELVMDTIDTAVFVVDREDRIVDFNEAAATLFEIEAIVGESVRELLTDRPNLLSVYESMAAETESTTRETAIDDQFVRIQMSPLREHDDRLVGRAFMVVDLTEQREREEQLRHRNEQLDRFAGVVSHDLRNPLEVADGSLQLARETGDEEHFERAADAHERMDRLIDDLLTLARQDEASLVVDALDLGQQVREAWGYVSTGDATLDVRVDGQTVSADADRLGQLLENCFRNAIEHGGETVTVTVGSLPDGAGFFVADDGPGFDEEDLDAVFDAGYTTSSDGTGFGLSIVKEIATIHGWSVAATASESGGARIEVRIAPGRRHDRQQ